MVVMGTQPVRECHVEINHGAHPGQALLVPNLHSTVCASHDPLAIVLQPAMQSLDVGDIERTIPAHTLHPLHIAVGSVWTPGHTSEQIARGHTPRIHPSWGNHRHHQHMIGPLPPCGLASLATSPSPSFEASIDMMVAEVFWNSSDSSGRVCFRYDQKSCITSLQFEELGSPASPFVVASDERSCPLPFAGQPQAELTQAACSASRARVP